MTPDERYKIKRFLGEHDGLVTLFILIAAIGLMVAVAKANNHLPEPCAPEDQGSRGQCFNYDQGRFDWALLFSWSAYSVAIAFLPAVVVYLNHLVFKGREKVGLTPEARRERMRLLERERDEANRRRIDAERRTKQLEQELEIA